MSRTGFLIWYWKDDSGKNMRHLICDFLKGPAHVQHLIVNGCGGAFLHPTHVFSDFSKFYGPSYETKSAYPSFHDSSRVKFFMFLGFLLSSYHWFSLHSETLCSGNILKFRKKNWQFDFIGGIIYFLLVFSLFPQVRFYSAFDFLQLGLEYSLAHKNILIFIHCWFQCKLGHILRCDSFSGHLGSFFGTVWSAFVYITEQSYVSFTSVVMLLITAIMFVPSKISRKKRLVIGILHVAAHLTAALILMLLLELGIEICIQHSILATSGYHTLYQWYKSVEDEHFPDPIGLRVRMEQWTYGLYPACIKYLMSAFDIPEVMAVTRTNICREGMESLSRSGAAIYYASVFLYSWLLIYLHQLAPHTLFDEAFSSLRIANYKSFTRFHIKPDGDLEVFTLGVDKVPKEWKLDKDWDSEPKPTVKMSHHRRFPSKWCATTLQQDPINTVKIVDRFVISRSEKETTGGS
ncbi:unnamed protein product [Arabis nemorensis]|uniref:Uncharacterized protein n=1 Tax=Arabis nemorensis TaxID=586526 RepID=A0A565CEJ4_9BRAS|nr:unnamed protein product [Arabis nemorensis]